MDPKATFGERVRLLRTRKRLSQEALAERAGMHWTYISGLERGRRNPSLTTLLSLARALDVPVERLVAGLPDQAK